MSGAIDRLTNSATIKKIKPVFDAGGIPAWLWMPIAARESGFSSTATANTASEYSKGLFQINVKAHPQYATTDLYDPIVNATIARDIFIKPAYEIAKTITSDPRQQALIVYSGLKNPESLDTGAKKIYIADGGIRPKWTVETRDAFLKYYDQYAPITSLSMKSSDPANIVVPLAPVEGQGAFSMGTAGGSGGAGGIGMTPEGMEGIAAMPSAAQKWGKVGIIVLIIVVMAISVFLMIGKNPVMAIVQKVGQGGESQ